MCRDKGEGPQDGGVSEKVRKRFGPKKVLVIVQNGVPSGQLVIVVDLLLSIVCLLLGGVSNSWVKRREGTLNSMCTDCNAHWHTQLPVISLPNVPKLVS